MRKFYSILVLSLCLIGVLQGQSYSPQLYKFAWDTNAKTLTPLVGSMRVTAISDTVGAGQTTIAAAFPDNVVIPSVEGYAENGFPIGFDFVFHGDTFNEFLISGRGFIKLGKDSVSLHFGKSSDDANSKGILSNESIGLDADENVYGRYNTSISYMLEGAQPNRVLTVEFLNLGYDASGADSISYQIKLYETSNDIQIIFGDMYVILARAWFGIGIAKACYPTSDIHLRLPAGNSRDWTQTVMSQSTSARSSLGNSHFLPAGLRFTWSVPDPCTVPTASATSFSINDRASTFIKGTVLLPAAGADGYEIYTSDVKTSDISGMTLLKEGALAATVNFQTPNVTTPSTDGTVDGWKQDIPSYAKKYFYAYLVNSNCIGKEYSSVIVDSAEFMPLPPTSFTVTATDSGILLSASANNAVDSIIIALSPHPGGGANGNPTPMQGFFGIPAGIVNIGDTLEYNSNLQDPYDQCPNQMRVSPYQGCDNLPNAGIVIYKGTGVNDFIYNDNIQPNRKYHFAVWTKNSKGEYSTVSERISVFTMPVTPYTINFEQTYVRFTAPTGWTVNTAGGLIFRTSQTLNGFTPSQIYPEDSNVLIESPYIKTESVNGVRAKFGITGYSRIGSTSVALAQSFTEKDTFYFEYTTDGINYTVADMWVKDAMPNISSSRSDLKIRMPNATTTFKFRMRWNNIMADGTSYRNVAISNFIIEDIPDCDPVAASDIYVTLDGTSAIVGWKSQDITDATAFDVRYKSASDNTWTTVRVNRDTVILTNLPQAQLMNLEISAVCAVGKVSPYVPVRDFYFYTGYNTLPFRDNFDMSFTDIANAASTAGLKYFPAFWDEFRFSDVAPYDVFNDTNTSGKIYKYPHNLYTANYAYLLYGRVYQWKGTYDNYLYNNGQNQAMILKHSGATANPRIGWFVTREIQNLKSDTKIAFDMAVKQSAAVALSDVTGLTPGAKFYVAFIPHSADDTVTITKANLLLELDSAAIISTFSGNDSVHYELDLSNVIEQNLTVAGRIGFNYVTTDVTPASLVYLDNVVIENACTPVDGLAITQASVDSIDIVWNIASGGVSDYMVKVYNGDGTVLGIKDVAGTSYRYNPAAAGAYDFSIGYLCGGDTTWSNIVNTVVTEVCDVPSNLRATVVTSTSATVTWTGPALVAGYNVQIRTLDSVGATPSAWINDFTAENTYTVSPLEEGIIYEYRVQSKCGNGIGDTSDWSAIESVTAAPITCFTPENIAVTPAYYSAVVSWSNNGAGSYEYGYRSGSSGNYTTSIIGDTTVTLSGLTAERSYQVRVRSICGDETSTWSEPLPFNTTSVPPCPLVTNLQATAVAATSATLQWDAPADYFEFVVTYRSVNVDVWDTAGEINAETTRSLANLTPNTAYTWRVRNLCDNNRASNWANVDNFNTLEEVAVEDMRSASTFKIYVSGGQINVINLKNEYIESIALTSVNGAVLQRYSVHSRDNVLVTTTFRNQVIVVVLYGKNGIIKSEKVLVK
ncbi:MAG: fibronectin type III domain-containing protein [Bacteroidales bacterium]|jgi:hypothetical protein|nr:fibronectin type III domain-containing protein [Bacteroidales bacterium]